MTCLSGFQIANTLLRCLAALCMTALLAGCYVKTEPVSHASVTPWQTGKPVGQTKLLTPQSTEQLSTWLAEHRWGWIPVHGTFLPALTITLTLTHSDGTVSTANLRKGSLIMGDYQLSLADAEYEYLRNLLSASKKL